MKLRLLAIALLFLNYSLNAQGIDKPKYLIQVNRLTNFLGNIEIELFPIITPLHVANFDTLVAQQFFDSTAFHRVVPGFVIQGGDPNSINGPINTWGNGQPWQPTVNAEFNAVRHLRGIIGAARDADPNSANSQFYICVGSPTYLDGNYTVFGRVTSGMNIVDSIVTSPRDANDVPLQKISMFVSEIGTNPTIPAAPALILPVDSATGILNSQIFTWQSVDSVVLYEIQFSADSMFNTINYSDTVPLLQAPFPLMTGLTEYFWRVRANNGGHESPWSSVRRFDSATGKATGIYPANASTGIPVNLNIIWTSVPGATSYRLQVAKTPTFSLSSIAFDQSGLVDTVQTVLSLTPNQVYYWRVQSAAGTQTGMYSDRYYFNTGTSTSVNEFSAADGSVVNGPWPNPAQLNASVQFILKSSQLVKLEVLDVSGRQILSIAEELSSGERTVNLPVENFKSGMYIVVIHMETQTVFRQLIKE